MLSTTLMAGLLMLGPPPSPAVRAEAEALIRQLGADRYMDRTRAEEKLYGLGVGVISPLRKALRSTDLEVRLRAGRVLERIEKDLYGPRGELEGHTTSVNSVCFSADGKRAYAADSRGIHLWDLESRKKLAKNEEHLDRVMGLALSPDGKLLASASEDRSVRLWQADTLKAVRTLRGHTGDARGVVFDGDGKALTSAGMDGRVVRWEVATGKKLHEMRTARYAYLSVAPAGAPGMVLCVVRGGREVMRCEPARAASSVVLQGLAPAALAVSANRKAGRAVASTQSGNAVVWDLKTGKQVCALKGHQGAVTCVAISPDGSRALTGGVDRTLRLWDLDAGTEVRVLKGHTGAVWCVAFSPDGKRALSGAQEGTLRLWAVGH